MTTVSVGPGLQFTQFQVLPEGIVQYFGKSGERGLTMKGIRLWLNHWWGQGSAASSNTMPPAYLGIVKVTSSDTGISAQNMDMFAQPATPSAVASWTDAPQGRRDYLWRGCVFPRVGALISGVNFNTVAPSISANTFYYDGLNVTQPYQPQVEVRTKRRMRPGDQLEMFIQMAEVMPTGMTFYLQYALAVWAE